MWFIEQVLIHCLLWSTHHKKGTWLHPRCNILFRFMNDSKETSHFLPQINPKCFYSPQKLLMNSLQWSTCQICCIMPGINLIHHPVSTPPVIAICTGRLLSPWQTIKENCFVIVLSGQKLPNGPQKRYRYPKLVF